MFGEMEDVVTQQQDVLDNIEQAVDETHVDMDQGNVEVKKATRFRIKARKVNYIPQFSLSTCNFSVLTIQTVNNHHLRRKRGVSCA